MTENQIQELKNEGMKQRLWGEADSCVWEARRQLESAKKEDWRDAEKCFRLVRTLVDDAEQCLTEAKKIS